ncbi:hypothetical protein C0993_004365 [Termitomyces sp. T159_Od127]|nr:hypothetical protein C0993_004365 [Termitomyces sp. T159_Od127]
MGVNCKYYARIFDPFLTSHGLKGLVKQEDNNTFVHPKLLTMTTLPTYPDQSKSDKILFGDWSFSSASSNYTSLDIVDPSSQSQCPVTCTISQEHDSNLPAPFLFHDQSSVDDSSAPTPDSASPTSPSSLLMSEPLKTTHSHIPRPPNAFMLYRSDFLKRGIIPAHVERRQQNLSRIAGQCWNLLPPEEKAQWQERAAQALLEHQKRNPDYKFTPAPRGSRRTKVKGRSDSDEDVVDGGDRIRQIREKYARIAGPTVAPTRRRRPKGQNRSRDLDANTSPFIESIQVPLPLSIPPSPCSSISSPEFDITRETPLPPFFPHQTIPRIIPPRRPSTSLGFSTDCTVRGGPSPRTGFMITRPSSAASQTDLTMYMKDLDITPTVPTFNRKPSPASPVSPSQPITKTDLFLSEPLALQDEFIFPTLNPPLQAPAAIEDISAASDTDAESFLGSLYSEAFSFNLPIVPAEEVFEPLQNPYTFHYDLSSFQSPWSHLDTSLN